MADDDVSPSGSGDAPAVDARMLSNAARALREAGGVIPDSGITQPAASADLGQIGPYRILEQLGEGGMGSVYKAEQRSPIKRLVAIKVIKLGFGSREIIARFESERQALALMDHPNVAKVLDAGTTDTGRPYFVMEYVPGKPITRFCDDEKLSIPDRLRLFRRAILVSNMRDGEKVESGPVYRAR